MHQPNTMIMANIHLKFYADKKKAYSNRLFAFHLNHESEILRLLYLFYHNGNKFRKAYIDYQNYYKIIELKGSTIASLCHTFELMKEFGLG